ncbi:MAG: hypothetical protein BJBARM5_0090 [Candidatus Parvarchaeum acidophilus ARMAN-5]|jgi:hypothetical protein|uniref:Uncharacterized protein n=1 Tax=Candidatus Parvarchaeum acidophilus ARMAN-5 TaxID=662762 RepID=D6GUF6_PARA5|nr:MAG: hypothetical protein BJBARM5_0090 [Candidatus Parvarchaeum acidophilus ARMAN-5]
MNKKGQSGVMIVIVILVIAAVAFFLYKSGYLSQITPSTSVSKVTVNPYLPISFNISSPNDLSQLYTNEAIGVITSMKNSGNKPINVSLSPYGCSFLPITSKHVVIPADSPSSIDWSFSGSSPTTCTITFTACFNAVSYTNYPLTIKSYKFIGTAPTSASLASSGLPINIYMQDFNDSIFAAPSSQNDTEYVMGSDLTSEGSTLKLNWLSINIANDVGYFTDSLGNTYKIDHSINITQQEYPLTFQNGNLLAPVQFSLLVNPVSNPAGYTNNIEVNVSAGYTYCITSNSIPITLRSS